MKSGRLNCKDPNIQQIPKRKAAYVRKLFIPEEGNVFVAMEYAQLEVRVLACVCKDPNIQQIPKRKAAYVRKLFIPGEGNVFVAMDYAQLEVRVLACVCRDPNLIEYLIHDRDIHKE